MNRRELATAVRMYQAALHAGATPNNALFLVGAAYQESSFNPHLTGSDGGTSFGLMQVGSAMWRQMQAAGVANDPVAQMTYYVNYLQDHQPGTWAAMQSAESVPGVFQSLYANRDWRLGAETGRMATFYADQLSQILNNESAPSNLSLGDLVSGGFGANNLPDLSNAYGLEQSYGTGYPVPTVSRANYPIVDFSHHAFNPVPSQETFNPVDNYSRNPEPSWFESLNPVDSYGQYNPMPWNETLNPVDQYSQQPYNTGNLDYEPLNPVDQYSEQPYDTANLDFEPLNPVDTYSDQISSPGEITDNPFLSDPFQGAGGEGELFSSPAYQQPLDLNNRDAGIAALPGLSWNDILNAPHTGEVFAARQIDPNSGRISTFDPVTGSYIPVSGAAGWSNTGYGAGSPFGAGSAGYGGGGFGGYGGLGGTGAPVTGHIGGFVDTSTPGGLSHGGSDPSQGSSPGPLDRAYSLSEAPIRPWDSMKYKDDPPDVAPMPQQYPLTMQWYANQNRSGGSQPKSGGLTGMSSWNPKGYWAVATTTTDPSLAMKMPMTPGWQYDPSINFGGG